MEITTGGHWLRGTSVRDADSVLGWLSDALDESVVVLERGQYGYAAGYLVGGVRVYEHPDRPDMGVCVDVPGEVCEHIGLLQLARLYFGLDLRATRNDLCFDHVGFTPADLRDHWQADEVRTRAKVPKDARDDRQWRTCKWHESPTGDTFSMGSRSSTQYARCYDSRGFTRLELELSDHVADAAARELFALVLAGDEAGYALAALGWVRRFVDFVDASDAENVSRAPLLPFWEAFVGAAGKARVPFAGVVTRTIEDVRAWVEHQVAPALALIEHALGFGELVTLVRAGKPRWNSRHRAMLSVAGLSP